MSHPEHIVRLTRSLHDPIEAWPLEPGWSVVPARATEAMAKAVADAFSWLCTARSMRRRGVARVLLSSALCALERARFSTVDLFVNRANQPALRLYERCRFVEAELVAIR